MSLLFPYLLILFMIFLLSYNDSSATTIESTTYSMFQKACDELLELEKNFTTDQKQFEEEKKQFEEEKIQSEKLIKNTDVIRLNVGGQLIMTTRETLTRVPTSILAIMFTGRWQSKLPTDKEGNIFLNFNPVVFRHLLDQLQILKTDNSIIFRPPFIPTLVKPFNKMLQKLGLNPSLSSEDSIITLNVGGQLIMTTRETLTRVPKSILAIMFTGRRQLKLPTDKEGNIFLNFNPVLFRYLLDQLQILNTNNSIIFHPPFIPTLVKPFNTMLQKLGLNSSLSSADIISLNVGGQLIMTTRETLTRVPTSILAIMFTGRWQPKLPIDEEGNIFLNFNPVLFRYLLDQLQILNTNNSIQFRPPFIPMLVKPFNKMLQKLGLKPSLSSEDSIITLNVGGQTVTNRNKTLTRLSKSNSTTSNSSLNIGGQTVTDRHKTSTRRLSRSNSSFNIIKFDNNNNIFLDHDPKLFQHLISHLREKSSKKICSLIYPPNKERNAFKRMFFDLNIGRPQVCLLNIAVNTKWIQNGVTVAGGNDEGNGLNQFNTPYGLHVYDDQTVYVADTSNHRIVEWKNGSTSGQVVAGGNESGNQTNQLSYPTAVIVDQGNDALIVCDSGNRRVMQWFRRNVTSGEIIISDIGCYGLSIDNSGYLYVSDSSEHEVKRWKIGETNGTVVAGGNKQGNRLDQLNDPTYIFVDHDRSVYVSDGSNHRVTKWMEGANEGIVVAGSQGGGSSLTQLHSPHGIAVDQLGTVYVADNRNDRVVRWLKGATQGTVVVGGNGEGKLANQFNCPYGLSFDGQGDLYALDKYNHRVQKFNIDRTSNI